eukprot:7837407-Lingulodinium_polyedra.AAC.1
MGLALRDCTSRWQQRTALRCGGIESPRCQRTAPRRHAVGLLSQAAAPLALPCAPPWQPSPSAARAAAAAGAAPGLAFA